MSWNNEKNSIKGFSVFAIGFGTLAGATASLSITILAACLFYFTNISETLLPYMVAFILFLSGILGGTIAAKSAGGKGIVHGIAVGMTIFLILWIAAASAMPGPLTPTMLMEKLFLLTTGGAIGGFIGITLIP